MAYTPSSSPPSSPSLCPVDSSPSASPILEPVITTDDSSAFRVITLGHPLAACVKADRTPPQYEKRYPDPPPVQLLSGRPTKKHRTLTPTVHEVRCISEDKDSVFSTASPHSSEHDREGSIWDEAITKVVDLGHGTVSLSSYNLTSIPKRISELGNFFVIPAKSEQAHASWTGSAYMGSNGGRLFTRTATAPASTINDFFASRASANLRTSSIKDVSVGLPREEIQLFLAGNQIRSLPRELFYLQKMTVLIMRSNQLTHLPPEIVQLKNLRELNVSNNQLRYIPSEMLGMKLALLCLHPNPFVQLPASPSRSLSRSNSRMTISLDRHRMISRTVHVQPRVTTLVELSFRILFSHHCFPNNEPPAEQTHAPTLPEETVLSRHELPLSREISWEMPQPIRDMLSLCVPGSIETPEYDPAGCVVADGVTGIGVCPSPYHRKSVYVRHAEERYTWEETVAGVNIGGAVPVRWRGCQWGCLDFLDEEGRGEGEGDADGDEDVEMNEAEEKDMGVVQLIKFAPEDYADFSQDIGQS